MALDFASLIPIGGAVDPGDLATALNVLAALAGVSGDSVPTIASASTCSVFAGTGDVARLISISGTTGISSFGAHEAGERRVLRFASAGCVVNHSSAIVCPGAANITSEAGTLLLVSGDGTNCTVWQVWHPSTLSSAPTASLPRGHLVGLGLSNNSSDANNDIDIAVGEARDATNATNILLGAGLTKRLDAAWAAGTNQGGLDTGSKANSTTYHVHLISDGGSTVDVLFSTSLASPTMPGGYTVARRIGSVITDGSGNIRAFRQDGDRVLWITRTLDINNTVTGTRTLLTAAVPSGLAVYAQFSVYDADASSGVLLQSPYEADGTPSISAAPLSTVLAQSFMTLEILTNTSRQIAAKSNGASITVRGVTLGYTDRRGRDG